MGENNTNKNFKTLISTSGSSTTSDATDAKELHGIKITIPTTDENEKDQDSIFDLLDSKSSHKFFSRPTSEKVYDSSHFNVGYAVIFNQIDIKGELRRDGSEKDAADLSHVLNEIGFTVKICTNFTSKQIAQELYNCKYDILYHREKLSKFAFLQYRNKTILIMTVYW